MDMRLTSSGGSNDYRQDYVRLQRLLNTLPAPLLRDAAASAAGHAIKQALPILKSPDFGFVDRKGSLRRSIRTRQRRKFGKRLGKSALSLAYALAGGKRAPHAFLVHEGHAGPKPAEPHPFLDQALSSTNQQIFRAFADHLGGRVPAVVRKQARRARLRVR